jgi:hypothetical protein
MTGVFDGKIGTKTLTFWLITAAAVLLSVLAFNSGYSTGKDKAFSENRQDEKVR